MKASEKPNESLVLPGVNTLLALSWQIFKKEPYTFLGFSGWLFVPIVLNLLANIVLPTQFDALADTAFSIVAYGILSIWVVVAMTITTRQIVTQKTNDSIAISRLAWQFLIPYLLATILTSFLNLVGFALLVVPGILFYVWYAFAPTIILIEGGGFIEAFHKSKALVKGRFGAIFWRLVVGNLAIGLAYLLLFLLLTSLYLTSSDLGLEAYLNSPVSLVDQIITAAIDVAILPMFVIYSTVLYLETKKEPRTQPI